MSFSNAGQERGPSGGARRLSCELAPFREAVFFARPPPTFAIRSLISLTCTGSFAVQTRSACAWASGPSTVRKSYAAARQPFTKQLIAKNQVRPTAWQAILLISQKMVLFCLFSRRLISFMTTS